jgi:hypothetical protein
MDNMYFITSRDRAEVVAQELSDYVTVERYDDDCDKVTFVEPMSNLQLILLLHAGIKHGHNSLAKALGVGV